VTASVEPRAALGLLARTGRAVVVALGGRRAAPDFLAKTRIAVATTLDEGAVYHVAQDLSLDRARRFVSDAEDRFCKRACAELSAFTSTLGAKVVSAVIVAPAPKPLPLFASILKAHPLLHAAEGELYRRVFAAAAASLGPEPIRVPADDLAERIASRLDVTAAEVALHLSAMGKASGKPWAAEQKQAALGAWLALATTRSRP
jgi:hypothetical protein